MALLSFFQSFDATWFAYIYGLSHQSVFLDTVGILFAEYATYVWMVLLLFAVVWPGKDQQRRRAAAIVGVIAGLIARYAVKSAIVFALPRPRPFVILSSVRPLIDIVPWKSLQSFPSGHAIFFFALATVLYFFNKRIGIVAFVFATLTSIARVYVGVHWPSDVLGSLAIGTLIGWLAYWLYRNNTECIDTTISRVFKFFSPKIRRGALLGVVVLAPIYLLGFSNLVATEYRSETADKPERFIPLPEFNRADYDARLLALAHVNTQTGSQTSNASSGSLTSSTTPRLWPVQSVYPNAGAILPFKRIVAYYGNFYSRGMGVLGEYPTDQMLAMLASTTARWTAADPSTPAIPAIHYIATVAQASAGKEGKYILRMPDDQIDHAIDLANQIQGIVFLDVQVALSTLQHELPQLEKYLAMPRVHLGIDPEFSMKHNEPPGTVIGTFDAADINYAARYLAKLVQDNNLPPKVLVIHRFTQAMVTNYKNIQPLPEVQIVMDMDGFGSKEKKRGTYNNIVADEPVQFMGIKLFYKNDAKPPSTGLLTPAEVLSLTPAPIYIQYQ